MELKSKKKSRNRRLWER